MISFRLHGSVARLGHVEHSGKSRSLHSSMQVTRQRVKMDVEQNFNEGCMEAEVIPRPGKRMAMPRGHMAYLQQHKVIVIDTSIPTFCRSSHISRCNITGNAKPG